MHNDGFIKEKLNHTLCMIGITKKVIFFLENFIVSPIDVAHSTPMKKTLLSATFRHPRIFESNAMIPNFSHLEATSLT